MLGVAMVAPPPAQPHLPVVPVPLSVSGHGVPWGHPLGTTVRHDASLSTALCTTGVRGKGSPKAPMGRWGRVVWGQLRDTKSCPTLTAGAQGHKEPVGTETGSGRTAWVWAMVGAGLGAGSGGHRAHLLGWDPAGAHQLQLPSTAC